MNQNHFSLKILTVMLLSAYGGSFADGVVPVSDGNTVSLDTVNVRGSHALSGKTEKTRSYTIDRMSTATGMRIAGKDTPQSVSVITRSRLDDKAVHTLEEAMKNTTGVNVVRDSGLQTRFLSRGFYIDQIGEDGITVNVAGRSGYTAKIDVSPSTDLAVYDHIEVVRGATGLTQSNSEPGGTVNLIRKRPTASFKHTGELTVDHRGSRRAVLDVSGSLNKANTLRGRLVGAEEYKKSFKDRVWGRKHMVYGIAEADAGDSSVLTLGGMYQKSREVPDFSGIILPCENQKTAPFSSTPACNRPLQLPRNTYLGEDWSRLSADKYNLFSGFKHVFDNGWQLNAEVSYTKNESDAKVGQFFLKNEHAAGLSGEDAVGFLTEKNEVIPFEPKDKALEKLKAYRDETAKEYRERKDDFVKNRFDNTAFEQYRSRRAAERKAGFDECMSAPFALDFICQGSWGDPGVDADKSEFVDKALAKEGIFNNAAQRFPNSLYDSSFNRKATANRRYSYMPLRHTKDDRQWGIKLDLTGTYGLFGREHDFFVGYAYGDEKIRSEYLEIYERRHRVRPNTGATHGVYAGSCQEEPDGDLSSPLVRGHKEPDWQAYDEKGNRTVYAEECRNAKKIKTEPKLDAEGKQVYYYDEYSGSRTPVYVDVYELDEKGNKIQETNPDGTPAFTGFSGTVPVWKTVKVADDHVPALYNYAHYLNTNKTHSLTASTRFNVTGRLHLLGGLHYTRYETSQTKDMPVRYGQPASDFQTASSIKADQDHYTAKMQGHKLTPYAGITYDLTPQQSIYGSYTKIFKQQDNVDVSAKTILPPLVGTNYEVGWKGAFLQGRLNASFALFYLEQKNRTVVDFGYVPGAGGKQGSFQTVAKPIGKVVSRGAEFELSGELNEDWKVFAGYTYNKSRYKNAAEVNAERLAKNSSAEPYNFSNFTPVHIFRFGTSFHIPNTGLTVGGGVSAQSGTSSLYNIRQGGYGLIDGFVRYELGKHAKLSLIGTNLNGRTYFENNYNRTRGANNFYGEPRTVSMKLDWQF